MPFNVWCAGCGHLIGKGVRFNAEKKQIGMYHSTKVWSFSMRSPCCKTRIEVHTDPKNAEYVVVAGARRCVGVLRWVRGGVGGGGGVGGIRRRAFWVVLLSHVRVKQGISLESPGAGCGGGACA